MKIIAVGAVIAGGKPVLSINWLKGSIKQNRYTLMITLLKEKFNIFTIVAII